MEKSNLIQFLSNAAIMASLVFIPVMAQELGAGPFEIGALVGIFYLTYFIGTYLFGVLTDHICIKRMIQAGLLASALAFGLQILAHDLTTLFFWRAIAGLTAGIFPAALAVYAYKEREGMMGRFTAFTSLGWAVGAVLAGLIGSYQNIFIMSALFFLIAYYFSLSLTDVCNDGGMKLFPWRLIRKNLRIYLPYFLRALGAQTSWAIFPLYLLSTGADKLWVGVAYFVNLFAQFILMQKIERQNNLRLFNLGLLCSTITFALYAVLNNFWLILTVQLLLAYAFSTLQVGAQQEVLARNLERGGSVGLLNSIANLNAAIAPFLAGYLLARYGFSGVMWFSAFFSFIGLITFTKVLK